MTNKETAEIIKTAIAEVEWEYPMDYAAAFDKAIEALEQEPRWIPIKTRPLTEKEKEYFVTDAEFIYECDLPDDGQTVLITDKWGNVETDTFYRDDGCYFEDNCGEDDVVAWMPLPEPYTTESEGEECR